MFLEFALTVTLALPDATPSVQRVDFSEPVTQVITYPPIGVLNQRSGLPLPDGARQAFEDSFVVGSTFFGAFAITKDFAYGYVTGANSLEGARALALGECLKHGPACLIYAEIVPQGYAALMDGQVSLATEPADYFNSPDPSWNDFRAMAVSEDGAYSIVWGHATPRAANQAALAECTSYQTTDLPDLRDMPCVLVPFK